MKSRSLCALLVIAASLAAQNPSSFTADPGIQLALPSGLQAPIGYEQAVLFNTQPTITQPASMVIGMSGDLFLAETVGSGCNTASTTHIYRVPMTGSAPTQPFSISQFTTTPIEAHVLTYDPVTNAIYAAGTCAQTSLVYKIPSTGVPQVLNPANPLNDPDSLCVGSRPGSANRQLFIAEQDQLVAIDLVTLTSTIISVDLSAVSATALGNWASMVWDPSANVILATNVGRPVVRNTVAISFTGPTTAIATAIGPDNHLPLMVDQRGIRYFAFAGEIGMLNGVGATAAFLPLISNLNPIGVIIPSYYGNFFLLQPVTASVSRLDRPLVADKLVASVGISNDITLSLRAPAPRASEGYLVFTGVSGGTPGTPYAGLIAPLNADIITQAGFALAIAGDPVTANWGGVLSSTGEATATFHFPPGIIPSGVTFQLAFALGNPEYTSNATWVHTIP